MYVYILLGIHIILLTNCDFWFVMFWGPIINRPISGDHYPEVGFRGKNSKFFIFKSYESFKTEYIYKNQLSAICTYIHRIMICRQKNGVIYELFSWISLRSLKYCRKYFEVLIWGLVYSIYEKARARKSHASVPLNCKSTAKRINLQMLFPC